MKSCGSSEPSVQPHRAADLLGGLHCRRRCHCCRRHSVVVPFPACGRRRCTSVRLLAWGRTQPRLVALYQCSIAGVGLNSASVGDRRTMRRRLLRAVLLSLLLKSVFTSFIVLKPRSASTEVAGMLRSRSISRRTLLASPTNSRLIVCQDVEVRSLPCLSIRKREFISALVNKKNSAVCLLKCIIIVNNRARNSHF